MQPPQAPPNSPNHKLGLPKSPRPLLPILGLLLTDFWSEFWCSFGANFGGDFCSEFSWDLCFNIEGFGANFSGDFWNEFGWSFGAKLVGIFAS